MKRFSVSLAVISLFMTIAWCTNARAGGDRTGTVSISPLIGGCLFEGDQRLKTSMAYGGALGYNINENIGIELGASFIDSGTRHGDSVNVDTYFYHLDGLYHIAPPWGEGFQPYMAAGIGGMTFDYKGNVDGKDLSDTAFAFNYGGGFEYFLTDNFALRGDVRHIITTNGGFNDLLCTAGVTLFFGGEKPEPVAKAAPPPPPPPPVKKVEPAPAPAPSEVCIDLNVEFDFDKDNVKPEYHDDIKRVADFLDENPTFKGTIEGGTDAVGTEDYNLDLSRRRAESVKKYLVDEFGIDPDRLKPVGYGKARPIATNLTEEGRQKNRRAVRVYCSSGEDFSLSAPAQKCIVLKVDFGVGSADVDPEKYSDAFKEVADYMKSHPDYVGTVEGYTDDTGPGKYNLELSRKRAENVKEILVDVYGVPPDRLKTEGLGESRPINSNETIKGRASNRYAVQVICD